MNPLTQRHRAQQLVLRRATVAQLESLWPLLDWARLDASFPAFAVAVGAMVQRNRDTSAGLAARYLAALRRVARTGEFRPIVGERLNVAQLVAVLHSTTVAALKVSAAKGRPPEDAMPAARTVAAGAVATLVLDAGRDTIRLTAAADPTARGWRRVGDGSSCDFCRALIDDDVIGSPEIDFKAHDHCGCSAEVVYI